MMRIIRMSELKTIPWKNGGGVTREIAASQERGELAWRLSMADVDSDGPFSRFEGLTRILTVIEGNGMDLISAGKTQEALNGLPVRFDGALNIESKLRDGPLRDLNLMFNPIFYDGDVTCRSGPHNEMLQAGPARTIAVFALRGAGQIDKTIRLFAGDTMLLDAGSAQLTLDRDAAVLLISLERRGQTDASSSVTAAR
jgi:environmental stress-induced protein Ves